MAQLELSVGAGRLAVGFSKANPAQALLVGQLRVSRQ